MKLLVVVPSQSSLISAGTRIRYQRLAEDLMALGCALEIIPIDQLNVSAKTAEAVVISKVMNMRSILLAHNLRKRGVRVGIDLFDDYFSQKRLSGTQPQKAWLRQIADHLDFALCSTTLMAKVLAEYLNNMPVHQLRDCHADQLNQSERLNESLRKRLLRLQQSGELPVVWFGMGDHPIFDVGLSDLSQHADLLARLQDTGLQVNLSVLTNERALTTEGLRRIRQLPVRTTVEIWDEDRERERLEQSMLAFLPVADTPFSRAKSPNRAITALEHGCQVLTSATPVYSILANFVYTDPAELLADLAQDRARLRPDILQALQTCLQKQANPARESERLCDFLAGVPAPALQAERATVCVIHGVQPTLLPAMCSADPSVFCMRSPISASEAGDDLSFLSDHSGELLLRFSPRLWNVLARLHPLKQPHREASMPEKWVELPLETLAQNYNTWAGVALDPWQRQLLLRALRTNTLVEKLAIRSAVMEIMSAMVAQLLPSGQQLLNEKLVG